MTSTLVFSLLFILLPAVPCLALRPGADPVVLSPGTQKMNKPVSVSYDAILRCFPELEDEHFALKVDLRRLKEKIDNHYVTSTTAQLSRTVVLKTSSGQRKRLRLEARKLSPARTQTSAVVELISENGQITATTEPGLNKLDPTPTQINGVLNRGQVQSDEVLTLDTKLNGFRMTHRRDLDRIVEFDLQDAQQKIQLHCEDRRELGSICSCTRPARVPR